MEGPLRTVYGAGRANHLLIARGAGRFKHLPRLAQRLEQVSRPTMEPNIEHRTSNIEPRRGLRSMLNVRCWTLDVRRRCTERRTTSFSAQPLAAARCGVAGWWLRHPVQKRVMTIGPPCWMDVFVPDFA